MSCSMQLSMQGGMRTFSVPSGRSHLKPSKSTRPAHRTLPVIRSLSKHTCMRINHDRLCGSARPCLLDLHAGTIQSTRMKALCMAQAGSGCRGLPETMKAGYEAACW